MTTTQNIKGTVDIERLPVDSEECNFHDWTIKYRRSHILHSQCSTPVVCNDEAKMEKCQFCLFSSTLDLPHLPDMVFPNNVLKLTNKCGAFIEFNALDALKIVSNGRLPFKIACADVWQESRSSTNLEEKLRPFDWTFSTDYKGTLHNMTELVTEERIDLEKLKEKEKILFYQDLTLYEDELHDNGVALCNVKIRVMPGSFFILLRYFLRVDNVMVKLNDTRFYHEFVKNYILREYTSRGSTFKELGLPSPIFTDPNVVAQYLPLRESTYEKLSWN